MARSTPIDVTGRAAASGLVRVGFGSWRRLAGLLVMVGALGLAGPGSRAASGLRQDSPLLLIYTGRASIAAYGAAGADKVTISSLLVIEHGTTAEILREAVDYWTFRGTKYRREFVGGYGDFTVGFDVQQLQSGYWTFERRWTADPLVGGLAAGLVKTFVEVATGAYYVDVPLQLDGGLVKGTADHQRFSLGTVTYRLDVKATRAANDQGQSAETVRQEFVAKKLSKYAATTEVP